MLASIAASLGRAEPRIRLPHRAEPRQPVAVCGDVRERFRVESEDEGCRFGRRQRTEASREEFVKEKAKVVQALLEAKGSEALVRYVQDLRRAAGDKLQIMSSFGDEAKGRPEDE